MNNFFKVLFIIWLLSLIFAVATRADITPPFKEISSARPQLTITYTPQAVLDIALLVAQTTPYDVWKYNCWDYATDLKLELAKNGYDSRIIFGIVNCSSGLFDEQQCKQYGGVHAWVSVGTSPYESNNVWIEATTGNIITDRAPYKMGYYGVIKFNPFKKAWKAKYNQ